MSLVIAPSSQESLGLLTTLAHLRLLLLMALIQLGKLEYTIQGK